MSALSTSDIEERFLQLGSNYIDDFTKQVSDLFDVTFANFTKQLQARTQGSNSSHVREKLSGLMDKLVGRFVIVKDEFVARFQAAVNRAINEAEDGVELTDSVMQSFIDDNASQAMDSCLTIFKEESAQIIIEGLGEMTLDDTVELPEEEKEEEPDNSMSGSINDSEADGSEFTDPPSENEVIVTMPTDAPKRKGKSKLAGMLSRRAKKAASGNFRTVPGIGAADQAQQS